MHYRNESCSSTYFQTDHPENADARQWIECFMKARGIQSAVEAWLHVLRYYLDTPHSDIMRDATELMEKYGVKGVHKMLTKSYIPPGLEHYPAVTYQGQAGGYFLSIWEAAEGEEFIITHNGFGLWEGLTGGCPGLHRIFVISPRVAIVLRSSLLRPDMKDVINLGPFMLHSSLLDVDAAPATPTYANGEGPPINSPFELARYQVSRGAGSDSFVFQITKLSRRQTLELNSVVLVNVKKTGSLTFLSTESMLRTARAFRSSPSNLPESNLLIPLIQHLTTSTGTLRPPSHSHAAVPDKDIDASSFVDVALYVLLMQICTGRKQFTSSYERAYIVLEFMEKPTSFTDEINGEVEKAFQACKRDSEEVVSFRGGVSRALLLSSIPNELSSQLFSFMIPYMSNLGAVMSRGEGILETLQDEVAVVSFLTRAACSPSVWHVLSCSDPKAPKILSRLFKEGTSADEIATSCKELLCKKVSSHSSSSWYDHAYILRGLFGMAGPTTNPVSQEYYQVSADIIQRFDSLFESSMSERSKARLVRTMSKKHLDLLMSFMTEILWSVGYTHPPEDGQAISTRIGEMAIINTLAWWGRYRRESLQFFLDQFPPEMNFKLFKDEEAVGSN